MNNAAAERAAQNMKGKPGCRLAKLFPRGGEITLPNWERVRRIPVAVPKSLSPTPSVSSSIVRLTAMEPSIKAPDSIIKTQIRVPSTRGKRVKQIRVNIRAGNMIAFLEPSLSDNEESGTTHIVLTPEKTARVPSALAGVHPCSRR